MTPANPFALARTFAAELRAAAAAADTQTNEPARRAWMAVRTTTLADLDRFSAAAAALPDVPVDPAAAADLRDLLTLYRDTLGWNTGPVTHLERLADLPRSMCERLEEWRAAQT